ncbi:MAG: serine/threonine-protein phosphatase [Lentisphaeria bacterium]|nr:serine/threonine-protein phosphatase [Lentisphaeria bacterium]
MRNRAGVIMAGESNLGLHRKRNEDNFCCYVPPGRDNALAVVADGVGGHSNGAVASLICCRDLAEAFRCLPAGRPMPVESTAAFLRDTIREINKKVFDRNFFEQVRRPMSSTIVAAVFLRETVLLASAGDSRMYEYHPSDGLVQLSTDHSFSAEFAREHGFLPPGSETMKNLIARAVGPRSELEPELHALPRRKESRYLLCSDGASGCVPAETLCSIMAESATPRQAVDRIMRRVLLTGARDNITAIAVFPDPAEA